jgi:altronate hydrolase
MTSSPRTLRLHGDDDVIVALDTIPAGTVINGVAACSRIPRGHKLAMTAIAMGAPVRKFGQTIGFASVAIPPGTWVHDHNCSFAAVAHEHHFASQIKDVERLAPEMASTFMGYRRPDGRVGTRNYVGILTSVNCSASVATFIAEELNRSGVLADYPNIDGVIPLVHGTGCGLDSEGEALDLLQRTTFGYATNPNMGATIMVGLGCEGFQIARYKEAYGLKESETFRSFTIQDSGGTRKTVAAGVDAIRSMLPVVNRAVRTKAPASDLMLALQCGGSDGYSGITANVALGAAVDLLVAEGGTAILSETPEIYGAEHLLTARARNADVGRALLDVIAWWEDYVARNRMSMNNNPSPGNKLGGLSTILEKSLGAAAKGGTTTLEAVYRYAERVTARGFVFMDTPGYDPVSATGQVAGGANLIAFTTGRGSAYGCKPTPSMKLATNSDVFQRMSEDMDIDCGTILEGVPIEAKGREIFNQFLRTASGEKTKSERLGYGGAEFVPWQIGATM